MVLAPLPKSSSSSLTGSHRFCLPTVSPIPRPPAAPTPRVW